MAATLAGLLWGADPQGPGDAVLDALGCAIAVRYARNNWRTSAIIGGASGAVAGIGCMRWVPDAWGRYSSDGPLSQLLSLALMAGLFAAPMAITWSLAAHAKRLGASPALAWGSSAFLTDLLSARFHPLPWGVGHSSIEIPFLVLPFSVHGAALADGFVWGLASLFVYAPRLAVPCLGLWILGGQISLSWVDPGPSMTVAFVQPNTGAFDGRRSSSASDRATKLLSLSRGAAVAGAQLVVTPESAWPHDAGEKDDHRRDRLTAAWSEIPYALVGVAGARSNRVLVLHHGTTTAEFEKRALLPIAERRWLGWGKAQFESGQAPRVVDVGGLPIGIAICYEDLLPPVAAEFEEVALIAVTTNDAWLGPRGANFHLRYARILAATTRRWVVRAAANGPSAFIDPAGRLHQALPWIEADQTPTDGQWALRQWPVPP